MRGIHRTRTAPDPLDTASAPNAEPADMLNPLRDLTKTILPAVYGSVRAPAVFVQGSTARYYFPRFSRARPLRDYLQQTPD